MAETKDKFSAGEQALGYLYQVRFALLQMMQMPEDAICLIEKDDDLDFADPAEGQLLASLKHKARGDRLTDLSPDFWKSVRIWLSRFKGSGLKGAIPTFFLFTTGTVAEGSLLENFLPVKTKPHDIVDRVDAALNSTESKTLLNIKSQFDQLNSSEKYDFLSRITIFDNQMRIENIPSAVIDRMRTVRPEFRTHVYERFEGWWVNIAVDLMTGKRAEPAHGWEISEKLAAIADQYRTDNLPIDFSKMEPPEGVNPEDDDRLFVQQLRVLGLKTDRIRRAILDYYRAFEQRASWAREHVTVSGEVEDYDDRLVDEWDRYRTIVCEEIDANSPEEVLVAAGRELLRWIETNDGPRFRIRPAVTEAYVMVGSYHILANENPIPRVHWHPHLIQRLEQILSPESA